ncbi:MAG: nitroreductase family protein [Gammaproteobacteria bacterium]|nr:nitroreductase family protein [Gammaproteobacteria bacterium]MDE0441616.1 nitroreductase family protein [Gammaproteobacteria bacterium]
MELFDVMRTAFAARDFTADPVPDDVLEAILDNARFAPSGGNRQGWRVIVVRDLAKRAALGPLIEPTYRRYLAEVRAGANPWNTIAPAKVSQADIDAVAIPPGFIDRLIHAPVLLLVTVDLAVVASMDQHLPRIGVISGASIYPFVWNILLAARNEGLGGTLTTFLAAEEAKAKALFSIPENHALTAMLPIGKPVKQLTRLRRNPVAAFATVDAFDGSPFGD